MREKISLLSIGSFVSAIMALAGVLVASFFGSYVSKADYNSDMVGLKKDVQHIRESVDEIKEHINPVHNR